MSVSVRVFTQYFENYDFDGGQSWKPKGGRDFLFENVDSDTVMYADDLKAVLKDLVESESDSMNKYEYRGYEVEFHEPIKLKADLLEQACISQWDAKAS